MGKIEDKTSIYFVWVELYDRNKLGLIIDQLKWETDLNQDSFACTEMNFIIPTIGSELRMWDWNFMNSETQTSTMPRY